MFLVIVTRPSSKPGHVFGRRQAFLEGLAPVLAVTLLGAALAEPGAGVPTLTHADQVRRLAPAEARLGYPVRIRGVITGDVPAPDYFVQDGTAGIFVEGDHSAHFRHVLGDRVEVLGVTGPGRFAPVVREQDFHVLGRAPLPTPHLYTLSELADGQQDSQWVRVRGVVRSVSIDRASWREMTLAMNVASGSGQFKVRVPISHEQDFSSWIDSSVLIEGVCGSLFNGERQLVGLLFYVPRLSFIKVEALPKEIALPDLLRFSLESGSQQRVRVRGAVVHQQPDNALFLQNQGRGLRVLTQQSTRFEAGDVVEVFGLPAVGESAPMLEDAVVHAVGHGDVPPPLPLDLRAPWERYDGALVTTEARLLQRTIRPGDVTLLLQKGELAFSAVLESAPAGNSLLSIPLNSDLRVTGICLVRNEGLWRVPQSFRILFRSAGDVAVLRTPSWWDLRHTLWLLGITSGVLLLVVGWVLVMRRQVREQMAIIRQKLRSGAVLEERNRIARELHDTLEQELVGITMQLDLAVDCFRHAPQVTRQAMEMARKMSRHSMLAARRSVWDLRCHWLENGDLVSALRQNIETLGRRDGLEIRMDIKGDPFRLPTTAEMNLLRIGQEALTNAVKHSQARHITIELHFEPGTVRLSVIDDGRGFSPEASSLNGGGHFGLLDMRERAQSLGCSLQVRSQPGQGTQITIEAAVTPRPSYEEPKVHSYLGG